MSSDRQLRIGAVLLAAGQGSRLGNRPKCLLRLEGQPLVQRHIAALRAVGASEIVVVTGFYHQQIEPILIPLNVRVARNEQANLGQPSSVRLGIETLGSDYDIVIMMLCDQPLVDDSDLMPLIDAFCERSYGEILVPVVNGQRANPVLFSGRAIGEVLAQDQNAVCRSYMDQHPELVVLFETGNERLIADVDTQDDIVAFKRKFKVELEVPESVTDGDL